MKRRLNLSVLFCLAALAVLFREPILEAAGLAVGLIRLFF